MGRTYTQAFKDRAIELLADGMRVGDAARALGMPEPTLWKWSYVARADGRLPRGVPGTTGPPNLDDPLVLRQQFARLEQRLGIMEDELALLGKVSASLAPPRRRSPTGTPS